MTYPLCARCARRMVRHGKTAAGTERYCCQSCGKTSIIHRRDTRIRHEKGRLVTWLSGIDSKTVIAKRYGRSRRTLSKEFRTFFRDAPEPMIPQNLRISFLIVDGTYIHGDALCVLVAVTDEDHIFFRFAPRESYLTWLAFLAGFPRPEVVVADGLQGIRDAVRRLWPETAFQRCQFHVVMRATEYLSRHPEDTPSKDLLHILHRLKTVHTHEDRDQWITLFRIWEHLYARELSLKTEQGSFLHRKVRGARLTVRRALPHLFTYLDHASCPNTTNLVEGWVNAAIAEALRRHRGLRLSQKKTLVSILLSHLSREKPTRKFP